MKQEILFVDDETAIRELLSEYFRRRGYLTRMAATADEARLALSKQRPSLVVLDVALRESDGLALLEDIRASDPLLPVMMLTGLGFDVALLSQALKKGANGCMSKGLPLEHLLTEVKRILQAADAGEGGKKSPATGGSPAA